MISRFDPDSGAAAGPDGRGKPWNLGLIYPAIDDPQMAADEREGAALVQTLQAYRGTMAAPEATPQHVLGVIRDLEKVEAIAGRLQAFGRLQAAVDQGDPAKAALCQRMDELAQRWAADLLFVEVELRHMPERKLAAMIEEPVLADYRHFLERQRDAARYTLSEPEERIIVKKDIAGRTATVRFREQFAAKMDFGHFTIDGQEREVTQSDLLAQRFHPEAGVREAARTRIFDTYAGHLDLYTHLYTSVVKDHAIMCELRGYARPMDAENVPNEIPGEVVDTLVAVNRERLPMIHDFYAWKAQRLGLPRLKTSDLYVPLATSRPDPIAWDRAQSWIARALERFDGGFAQAGARMFGEQRIDGPPRKGKTGGGFCYPVPDRGPFVLVNYTGDVGALTTLTHEVGHAIHFQMATEHQTLFHALVMSKVIAETASEFGELLLTDLLLEEVTDPGLRQTLLNHSVDRFLGTVDRQLMFTQFEEAAHGAMARGPVGQALLDQTWGDLCRQHYGPHVELLPAETSGWATIPHFVFNPFYCYSYALSQVVVLALYATYKEKGGDFVRGYLELLSAGGSGTPAELLGRAGIDLADRAVLAKAYDHFEETLAALRRELGG